MTLKGDTAHLTSYNLLVENGNAAQLAIQTAQEFLKKALDED